MFLSPTEDLAADIKRPCQNMNAAEEMPVCSSMLGFMCRKGFDVHGLCCTGFLEVRSQELCPAGTELPGDPNCFSCLLLQREVSTWGMKRSRKSLCTFLSHCQYHTILLCLGALTTGPNWVIFHMLANYKILLLLLLLSWYHHELALVLDWSTVIYLFQMNSSVLLPGRFTEAFLQQQHQGASWEPPPTGGIKWCGSIRASQKFGSTFDLLP